MENKKEKKERNPDLPSVGVIQGKRKFRNEDMIPIRTRDLPGHIKHFIIKKKERGEAGEWIRNAITQQYLFEDNPKGFIASIMRNNYALCKHLLRQIGSQLHQAKTESIEPIEKLDYRAVETEVKK